MKVISIITNNPIFIELQYKSLKKYLHTEYEYIVFNDGKDWSDSTNFHNPVENGKIAIENKCKELDIKFYNLPNEHHKKEWFIRETFGFFKIIKFLYESKYR